MGKFDSCTRKLQFFFQSNFGSACSFVIERFHLRDHHLCKFIGTRKSFYIRKEFNSHRIRWNTNMAAVTSCENAFPGPIQLKAN